VTRNDDVSDKLDWSTMIRNDRIIRVDYAQ